VARWDLIRVITIRHSAWLASRLPPRLSRCRPATLPEEAGIGATRRFGTGFFRDLLGLFRRGWR